MNISPSNLESGRITFWYKCRICHRCFQYPEKLLFHKQTTKCGRIYRKRYPDLFIKRAPADSVKTSKVENNSVDCTKPPIVIVIEDESPNGNDNQPDSPISIIAIDSSTESDDEVTICEQTFENAPSPLPEILENHENIEVIIISSEPDQNSKSDKEDIISGKTSENLTNAGLEIIEEDIEVMIINEHDQNSNFDKQNTISDQISENLTSSRPIILELHSDNEDVEMISVDVEVSNPNYKCYFCDLELIKYEDLEDHIEIHTGEGDFAISSSYKPSQFNPQPLKSPDYKNNTRDKRQVEIHKKSRRHKCPKCDCHYKHPHSLKRHMWIHLDSPPFKCSVCKEGFYRNDYLKKHMSQH